MSTYYSLLGISPDAEPEVIAAAYRALAKKYHPDVDPQEGATDRLAALNTAYATLSDPVARRDYDASLRRAPDGIVPPAAAGSEHPIAMPGSEAVVPIRAAPGPRTSLVGDVVYTLIGVPIFWIIAIVFADVLLTWIGTVLLDWIAPDDYTFSRALQSLGDIIRRTYHGLASNAPPDQSAHTSLAISAFRGGWLFLCSAIATGAVCGHARDERPRVRLWTITTVIFALFAFLCYRRVVSISATATQDYIVDVALSLAGVFAGIVFGVRSAIKERAILGASASA